MRAVPAPGGRLRRRAFSVALGGLLVSSIAGLSIVFAADDPYTVQEFGVVSRDSAQLHPRIDGRTVVWQDYRDNQDAATDTDAANADIYLKNLDSGGDRRLNDDRNRAKYPDISGNRAVWVEASDSRGLDIRGYDIEDDDTFTVDDAAGDQDLPEVSGNTVVYQDNRGGNWDIRGYDIAQDRHFVISSNRADQVSPAIGDDLVAWVDYRDGPDNPNIFAYDLREKREFRVSDTNDVFGRPAVSGNLIAYSAGSSDQGIYVYDAADDSARQVSSTTQRKRYSPSIDGDLVAWTDERAGNGRQDIWAYDVAVNAEFATVKGGDDQSEPDVSGLTVVWQDESRNGDIRGANLTATDGPAAPPTPAPTTEPAPTPRPAPEVSHDARYFFETGFRIEDDRVWQYFNERGGVENFGYPISRTFLFLGFRTQFFQRQIVQIGPDGEPRLMNILDPGLMPINAVNGSTLPAYDAGIANASPQVGTADYDTRIVQFVQSHAPETTNNRPTRFWTRFSTSVPCAVAFPNGFCQQNLIPLMDLEMWGTPTSNPLVDPNNPDFIYLRFQRGIMHFDATCGCTQGILLASYFRDVLMGAANLPADLKAQMQSSPYYNQYNPGRARALNRPGALAATDLSFAFERG